MVPSSFPPSRRRTRPLSAASPFTFRAHAPSVCGSPEPAAAARSGEAGTARTGDATGTPRTGNATGTALEEGHATAIGGSAWTDPGRARAAVPAPDDLRKAVVK
ncbi:hypothetical protein ACIPJG_11875 [Streptomyces halstedii]|uniref:hypothetical protein n=1 Tax=Streptomyces TaxID=1883 RepID=UPI00048D3A0D|nr:MULTISPECIES: hypothetical protein [Streptomyces]MYR72283.1 hypothetical protein [Streptomyces sp. SID4925]MYY16362.1 hypothetical protein [Streptomyces sp. SID4912]SBU99371.1 hypothetical protein YUMDRAFT_01978 [Streptomyces sp. OspMP-M45]SCD75985.1 hypothetical protein GA0115249_108618 [Streptomyces sp. PpalLS-921]SCD82644.1 hypothetical protein GA0115241_1070112 [Streptomyces sp. DpondAA-D4]